MKEIIDSELIIVNDIIYQKYKKYKKKLKK